MVYGRAANFYAFILLLNLKKIFIKSEEKSGKSWQLCIREKSFAVYFSKAMLFTLFQTY